MFYISIHASAREATPEAYTKRPRKKAFQSTPPRGRRLTRPILSQRICYFNPRLREGGDIRIGNRNTSELISIHASAREATASCGACRGYAADFNPRLREGGDLEKSGFFLFSRVSIHASAREATSPPFIGSRIILFQSTPPRGRRQRNRRKMTNRDLLNL